MGTIGVDDVALGEVALVVVTMRSATAGFYVSVCCQGCFECFCLLLLLLKLWMLFLKKPCL